MIKWSVNGSGMKQAYIADGNVLLNHHIRSKPSRLDFVRVFVKNADRSSDCYHWLYAGDLPGGLSDEEITEKALALAVTCCLEDL
jgi:hypothetical protein